MHSALATLIDRLANMALADTTVIPWGSPVPAFGDLMSARLATVGLNPSNREFVSAEGTELDGPARRFHTLKSLGLESWEEADTGHLRLIIESCRFYFSRNPYDGWFRKLDTVISATRMSYYDADPNACHVDLIPYATHRKWTELSTHQRAVLLSTSGDTLGRILRESPIRVLVLNGQSVVKAFERLTCVRWSARRMDNWSLRRGAGTYVQGIAYTGTVDRITNIPLGHDVLVLGFNHNLQSSFGVTRQVASAIRLWVNRASEDWF